MAPPRCKYCGRAQYAKDIPDYGDDTRWQEHLKYHEIDCWWWLSRGELDEGVKPVIAINTVLRQAYLPDWQIRDFVWRLGTTPFMIRGERPWELRVAKGQTEEVIKACGSLSEAAMLGVQAYFAHLVVQEIDRRTKIQGE